MASIALAFANLAGESFVVDFGIARLTISVESEEFKNFVSKESEIACF